MSIVDKAEIFAREMHKGQLRKDGVTPYIVHPQTVVKLLVDAGIKDENTLAAAWLHDTMECCDVSYDTLKSEFNDEIANIVKTLTRDVERDEYRQRIANSSFKVKIIKLADVLHNAMSLFKELPKKTFVNIITDCQLLYFNLARSIAPKFYEMLINNLKPWMEIVEVKVDVAD